MRTLATAASALVLGILLACSGAEARCDAAGADAADVASARAAVATACDCAGAASRGAYVRCARAAAKAALANQSCLGPVVRCAAQSTCGRPGAVACCQTGASGTTRASIKGDASACRAPKNGSACVSPLASLCDACGAGGCAALPTPTPPAPTPTPGCGNGVVDPGEECDAPTCTALLDGVEVQSTCGAPGTTHACECRDAQCGACFGGGEETTAVLCWSDDQCALSPGGGPMCIDGACVPTRCDTAAECAGDFSACENGLCCVAGFAPPAFCRVFDQVELPCCGAAVCGAGDLATCCLPAGEACGPGATCCSGSCTSGTCD